jgi:hypothetical protein
VTEPRPNLTLVVRRQENEDGPVIAVDFHVKGRMVSSIGLLPNEAIALAGMLLNADQGAVEQERTAHDLRTHR